jgi:hypothetical protein
MTQTGTGVAECPIVAATVTGETKTFLDNTRSYTLAGSAGNTKICGIISLIGTNGGAPAFKFVQEQDYVLKDNIITWKTEGIGIAPFNPDNATDIAITYTVGDTEIAAASKATAPTVNLQPVLGAGEGVVETNKMEIADTIVCTEEETFISGVNKYLLSYPEISSITEVTGLLNAAPNTFVDTTDYALGTGADANKIDWSAGGDDPDSGSAVKIVYVRAA